ncbi:MAG TPA: biotin/lipoyl-containing protein, partial [Candidatus Limnocylindrales bacterium]|nr:biotin/lipoyl-containing protein [Candidatus Limnocylindrales bacterium]
MAKVTMPQLGESVAEGTIGRWLKQPGDTVAKYEPLLEVITDKVNAEVPSPYAGILREILAEEGAVVPNNAEIAIIETEDDAVASGGPAIEPVALEKDPSGEPDDGPILEPANLDAAAQSEPAPAPAAADPGPVAAAAEPAPASAPAAPAALARGPATPAVHDPNARMTPAVRRLLREHDLEAAQIAGTGGGGRITREDVLAHVEALRTGAVPAAPAVSTAATPAAP